MISEKQKEILAITVEECAEVQQAISKIFRFGLDSSWNGETNEEHLTEEIGDLLCMIELLSETGILSKPEISFFAAKKRDKLKKWSNIFKEQE